MPRSRRSLTAFVDLVTAGASPLGMALLVTLWMGCGGRPPVTIATPEVRAQLAPTASATSTEPVEFATLEPGVVRSEPRCTEGALDACNGLDDDCDARIDEGCGWQSGAIQVTVAWDNGADLDLYVVDPSGYTLSYMDPSAPGGGRLDHDARGACVPGNDTIENVFWNTPTAPRGRYAVAVHYWGECGTTGPTAARLSLSVGGRVLGVYEFTLSPGQRQTILAFTL